MSIFARALVAAIAGGLSALLLAGGAVADPRDDRARVERDIARTRAALETATDRVEAAAIALDAANRRLPELETRAAQARGALAAARVAADTAARAVGQADADVAAADRIVESAAARVERTRDEIGAYARTAYMGRAVFGIDALLSATDPASFVAGLTYLDHVAARQRQALDASTIARAAARNGQNVQALRRRTADEIRQRADAAVRAAIDAAAAADRAQRELIALVAQRDHALAVAQQDRSASEARLAELEAESQRIAAAIRGRASGALAGPALRAGLRLPMPVVGWKSSDFGMRFDPVYHRWQLHAGVDLAAPVGAPIRAAAGGVVLRAGWNGGYGNYTCLYHGTLQGRGFATCYAHQSAIGVRVGQVVRAGDVIGRVGTTGASTGNHLHFEVRLDGTPVDPLPWLPACLC